MYRENQGGGSEGSNERAVRVKNGQRARIVLVFASNHFKNDLNLKPYKKTKNSWLDRGSESCRSPKMPTASCLAHW
jgi:hypothetical protein